MMVLVLQPHKDSCLFDAVAFIKTCSTDEQCNSYRFAQCYAHLLTY